MQIIWKTSLFSKANAQIVADEISQIGEYATPEQILEKARDSKTELHKCFEWNDSIAAEKYRLHQARMVVCNLVYKEPKEQPQPPQRIRVMNITSNGYKQTKLILRNLDEYNELLSRAKAELQSFERKYNNISELEEVLTAIRNL